MRNLVDTPTAEAFDVPLEKASNHLHAYVKVELFNIKFRQLNHHSFQRERLEAEAHFLDIV